MSMPEQKPGRSEQVVCTPKEFLQAVKNRLNIEEFSMDLAADKDNTVAEMFFCEENSALDPSNGWLSPGWSFCNPPYGDIEPWVSKAVGEAQEGAHVAMLVPASVGSNWWRCHVDGFAYVTFLHPRLTFVGHTSPYPKDLALLLYAPFLNGGYTHWKWR